jgi:hypothetical protein
MIQGELPFRQKLFSIMAEVNFFHTVKSTLSHFRPNQSKCWHVKGELPRSTRCTIKKKVNLRGTDFSKFLLHERVNFLF